MYIIGFDDSIYIDLIILIAFSIAPVDPLPVGNTMYYSFDALKLYKRLS